MSQIINCQTCTTKWEVREDDVPVGIQDGVYRVTRGTYGTLRYFGLCVDCRGKTKRPNVDLQRWYLEWLDEHYPIPAWLYCGETVEERAA